MTNGKYEALLDAINNLGAKFDQGFYKNDQRFGGLESKFDTSFDKVFNEMSIKVEAIPNETCLLIEGKLTSIANSINQIGKLIN